MYNYSLCQYLNWMISRYVQLCSEQLTSNSIVLHVYLLMKRLYNFSQLRSEEITKRLVKASQSLISLKLGVAIQENWSLQQTPKTNQLKVRTIASQIGAALEHMSICSLLILQLSLKS